MTRMFKNLDDLHDQLDAKYEGVVTVPMWEIRDAYGAGKLGVNIVASISEKLEDRGIGHWPAELPREQYSLARFFLKRSPAGKVINAALNLEVEQDKVLRKLANEKSDDLIKKVRELVCD